jgi:hypothetical protein
MKYRAEEQLRLQELKASQLEARLRQEQNASRAAQEKLKRDLSSLEEKVRLEEEARAKTVSAAWTTWVCRSGSHSIGCRCSTCLVGCGRSFMGPRMGEMTCPHCRATYCRK